MPLTEERMDQIQLEETMGPRRRPPTPDLDPEERDFRRRIRRDIKMMLRAGIEIVVPNSQPDISEP